MEEIFKDIPGFEGIYQASNLGRVKSMKFGKERILKQYLDKRRYFRVCLKGKVYRVHKLIAMAFLNHISCGMKEIVDHIDSDTTNNNVNNLQVTTQRVNAAKAIRKNRTLPVGVFESKGKIKTVYYSRIYINGVNKIIGKYETINDASDAYLNEFNNLKK